MKPPKVDLHGLTREEALIEVDREINHTFIQEQEDRRLRFITGHGEVLRPAILEFLTSHPLVAGIQLDGPSLTIILENIV